MAANDFRMYETFYGVHLVDWEVNYPSFANHHKILTTDYYSEGCSEVTSSVANDTYKFIYPHHIKKIYFIEGVIKGHITLAASGNNVTFDDYRVTVCKVDDAGNENELFSTGWITINSGELSWNAVYSVGDEIVLPFEIDAWEKEKLDENDRIYVKVQTDSQVNGVLWHSNDATWEDLKITIPFIL